VIDDGQGGDVPVEAKRRATGEGDLRMLARKDRLPINGQALFKNSGFVKLGRPFERDGVRVSILVNDQIDFDSDRMLRTVLGEISRRD
jgi:hypothetical protein